MGKFCSDFAGLAEISDEGKKIAKKVSGEGASEKEKKGRRTKINLCSFSLFFFFFLKKYGVSNVF